MSQPEAGPSAETALRTLTHDLRNALGPIRTAAFLLRGRVGQDPEAERLRGVIQRQAEVMAALLDASQNPAPAPLDLSPGRALRLLIIDDDPHDRELLGCQLERDGHEILQASGGLEGVGLALSERPDCVLIDLELPDLPGLEVAEQIRAGAGKAMVLVALTGHSDESTRNQALACGFDRFVVKASDPGLLLALLRGPLKC
jgi:hypothetical protein